MPVIAEFVATHAMLPDGRVVPVGDAEGQAEEGGTR